jgi:hypothetical protein
LPRQTFLAVIVTAAAAAGTGAELVKGRSYGQKTIFRAGDSETGAIQRRR